MEALLPRMVAGGLEQPLEGDAVVQVLARMKLEADFDAVLIEYIEENGVQRRVSSAKASSTKPAGRCGEAWT
ncbi:hypothetical protein [Novosphingobium sp. BW1]|uniref:hypothetical protein n=1 Tax=Novosphingobium sp. BW1 TaxID=2592621 RepID=UPI00352F89F0